VPGRVEHGDMTDDAAAPDAPADYAMTVADGSYGWYHKHAIESRRLFKVSETTLLVLAAAIPVAAAIAPGDAVVPAILGGLVVVLTGLRTVFHWQDNYLRFSGAREAVEAERRLYRTGSPPYDDVATRDSALVAAVSRIEQAEMGGWIKVASERPKA
jgi:hypothetical protein